MNLTIKMSIEEDPAGVFLFFVGGAQEILGALGILALIAPYSC